MCKIHGQDAIVKKGEIYLPNPSPIDENEAVKKQRYMDYQKRAVFYNVTKRTANAMAGMVFAKYPTLDIDPALEFLKTAVDGGALSFVGQARQAFLMMLLKGRGGLLADYPYVPSDEYKPTKAQVKKYNYVPKIRLFEPKHIINWCVEPINNANKLTLLVLKESYIKSDDGFKAEYGEQLIVYRWIDGVVHHSLYQKDGVWREVQTGVLSVTDIPFTFFGSNDNDETMDDAPLYDLAVLNLAHYRNSADYEEGNFIAGQPSLFITGLTKEWVSDIVNQGHPIRLGARTANILGSGANAFLLQSNANSGLYEAMQNKKEQMVALGARLIEPKGGTKTATQAQSEKADETSITAHLANNLSDAYSRAFNYCGQFLGIKQISTVVFNTKFDANKMTADERRQLIAEWQTGAITFSEMRARLIDDEIAFIEDDELAKSQINSDLGEITDHIDDEP
ncbi:DUF4055 domain-containing protein [Moraxella nonliquefaciens]|uniref:DUF4055 domain-containing protein n=1 Tax=Moraxella nonliquefaciens TaxID=478 RepID=UPI0024A6FBB8|nr:DUF4055 domain-containing protein [Moraxella nonliquefaciens]